MMNGMMLKPNNDHGKDEQKQQMYELNNQTKNKHKIREISPPHCVIGCSKIAIHSKSIQVTRAALLL